MAALKDQAPEAYRLHVLRHAAALAFLGAVVVLACVAALWSGSYTTPLSELLRGIFGAAEDPAVNTVVRSLRLPRICTALLGGAGLGAAGCVLQSVLRNPLASASTLGISQGAGFGAAFAIIVLGAGIQSSGSAAGGLTFTSPVTISLCAFLCSMAVSLLILALSRLRSVSAEAMVLAGVALSSLFPGPPRCSNTLPTRCSWPPWCSGPSAIWAAPPGTRCGSWPSSCWLRLFASSSAGGTTTLWRAASRPP